MKYTSQYIPLEDLVLDALNPRFVNIPDPDQESIKEYLIEYEDVLILAKGINEEGGLLPGERVIVCKENGKYIVLEGNRRICACKLLVDLLDPGVKLTKIKKETIDNILEINTDIVESRESVQSALFRRHIEGIKLWKTQAKQYFFARRFFRGDSIEQISKSTNSTKAHVKDFIQRHNLLTYALNVPNWKKAEKESINRAELEVDKFFRSFYSVSPTYGVNARYMLGMTYDDSKLSPKSDLNKEMFDRGLYIIAKAAFVTDILNTRNHVEVIPEFVDLYNEIFPSVELNPDPVPNPVPDPVPVPAPNPSPTPSPIPGPDPGPVPVPSPSPTSPPRPNGNTNPTIPVFFSALQWGILQSNDQQDYGLISLASEIKNLSEYTNNKKETYYEKFPFSTTIIMRSLIEQSLKFYIKKMGKWTDLIVHINKKFTVPRNDIDPALSQINAFIRSGNISKELFVEKKYMSAYSTTTSKENIDYMDTVVHSSEMITPTKLKLESIAANGMYTLIYYILNEKKHWPLP
jgi:hypothetical protein